MSKQADNQEIQLSRLNDYLANERTFLSWIRTSIGIMAFGFVVEKFALFMRQISFFLSRDSAGVATQIPPEFEQSSALGISLVGLGALIGLLAFIKYKRAEKLIERGIYRQSFLLEVMLTLSILSIGIFLMIYLIHST
jgi:uncharacterized membrane protein YidH (DUF202 family)